MTSRLPPVPARGALADVCREVAARENVQPYLVEKPMSELHAVLRSDAPAFDLDAMLAKFEGLWRH